MYKKWISTRRLCGETKYKNYKKIYRKVANEAECKYYKTMFDQKTNSIKQLWKNLNTVCSFKQAKSRSNSISKLKVNGVTLYDNKDIWNGFNSYFSTVGQNLVADLINNNKNTNVCDFKTYCPRSIINSIFITPTDEYEILDIINKLRDSKAPGYDNIGPKLIKYITSLIIRPLTHIYLIILLWLV